MSRSGIRILTISPGAWPWAATPLRHRQHRWSSPEEGFSPSWTLRPPQRGRPSFYSLLLLEEERFLLLPSRLREGKALRGRRVMSPTPPGAGSSFEFPWPSSWPSSPAPSGVPESAASSNGRPLGLRAKEPDSLSVWTSSASPVKGMGDYIPHRVKL